MKQIGWSHGNTYFIPAWTDEGIVRDGHKIIKLTKILGVGKWVV